MEARADLENVKGEVADLRIALEHAEGVAAQKAQALTEAQSEQMETATSALLNLDSEAMTREREERMKLAAQRRREKDAESNVARKAALDALHAADESGVNVRDEHGRRQAVFRQGEDLMKHVDMKALGR